MEVLHSYSRKRRIHGIISHLLKRYLRQQSHFKGVFYDSIVSIVFNCGIAFTVASYLVFIPVVI